MRDGRRTALAARPAPHRETTNSRSATSPAPATRSAPTTSPATSPASGPDAALDGVEHGRIGALAGQGQRDLTRVAAAYPRLFASRMFDPAMFTAIALASASSAPWLRRDQSRLVNRMSLWLFGLDHHVERLTPAAVPALTRRLLAVAAGTRPAPRPATVARVEDDLAALLAAIRDDLARAVTGFDGRRSVWLDALRRTLAAVAREQRWSAGPAPRPAEYLDNAASTGFAVVFAIVWLTETGRAQTKPTADLVGALDTAERVLRLVNDLGTVERERATGDLNVLSLGLTRAQVAADLEESTDRLLARLAPVRLDQPRLATYVERQVGYAIGLYGIGDFWGPR